MPRKIGVCLFACVLLAGCSSGYEPARSPRVAIVIDDGLTFVRDGRHYRGGFFSGNGAMDAVQGDARAEAEARTARNFEVAGTVFSVVALGSAAGALAVASGDTDGRHTASVDGLLIAALASELFAAGFVFASLPHLYDSANIYNDDLDRAGNGGSAPPKLALPPLRPLAPPGPRNPSLPAPAAPSELPPPAPAPPASEAVPQVPTGSFPAPTP